jgi:hypothetical protein
MDQELWTKKDVARFLRRSVSSIDHAVSSRKIPYLKVSRHVAYSAEKGHLFRNRKPLSHSANPIIQTMS